jgi:FkbM family methyltransferase
MTSGRFGLSADVQLCDVRAQPKPITGLYVKAVLRRLAGRNPWVRARLRVLMRSLFPDKDPELKILEFLVSPGDTVIDVGANIGLYVTPLIAMGCKVIAIEPNPTIARELELMYGRNIRLVHAAASNVPGTAKMRVPAEAILGGLGTIEPENALLPVDTREFEVPTVTIDSLGLADVDLIKIDVEGHELSVLQGAEEVLKTKRPRLILEAENRHRENAVGSIFDYLHGLGYEGFMLVDGLLSPIEAFDPAVHQRLDDGLVDELNHRRAAGAYVNNFVFLPS